MINFLINLIFNYLQIGFRSTYPAQSAPEYSSKLVPISNSLPVGQQTKETVAETKKASEYVEPINENQSKFEQTGALPPSTDEIVPLETPANNTTISTESPSSSPAQEPQSVSTNTSQVIAKTEVPNSLGIQIEEEFEDLGKYI